MLAFPVLSGFLLGGLSWPGTAFTGLVVAGFLAHESILVVAGGRGERLRSANESAARARLVRVGAAAVVAGAVFALLAPEGAWRPALVSGALALSVAGALWAGRTRSLGGELLVAGTFASVHAAVAASAGAPAARVSVPAVVWATSFALATLAVHALKYRFKRRGPGRWTVVAAPSVAAATGLVGALGLAGMLPGWTGAASVLPKALVVVALAFLTVHPRHLKRVGWTLVVADTLTLGLLALLVR